MRYAAHNTWGLEAYFVRHEQFLNHFCDLLVYGIEESDRKYYSGNCQIGSASNKRVESGNNISVYSLKETTEKDTHQ